MSEQSDLLNAARTDLIPGIVLAQPTFEDEATIENEFASWFLRTSRMSTIGSTPEDAALAEDAAQRKLLTGELTFGGPYFSRWAQNPVNAPLLTFILARRHYQVSSPNDIKALLEKVRAAYDTARRAGKGDDWRYRQAVLELYGFDFSKKKGDAGSGETEQPSGASSSEKSAPPSPTASGSASASSAV